VIVRAGRVVFVTFAVSAAAGAVLVAIQPPRPPPPAPPATASAFEPPGIVAVTSGVHGAATVTAVTVAPPAPSHDGPCPADMVLVDGFYCPFVAHVCKDERAKDRVCAAFEPRVLCEGTLHRRRFCVDRFEYPNQAGVLPAMMVDFEDAERACAAEDKRLCTVTEWQLACEGERLLPYPTGVLRDKAACNWDRRPETSVAPSRGPRVAEALVRSDGREPAGAATGCASPFGAMDMAGNVAEWVREPNGGKAREPFASVVAGGAWGPSPGTCRSVDTANAPTHRASTLGFRCCTDPAGPRAPDEKRRPRAGFRPIPQAGLP
jgi:hypothetical protein